MAGSASSTARSRSAAASCLFRLVDGGIGLLAGRVIDDLGVGLDTGDVVADLVDPVVLAGVFEEVLLPPPGLQPGQDLRRARAGIRGQDLQGDLAVLEQGELPGFAVVLELDGFLCPGDLPPPPADGDGSDDREHGRDGQRRPPVADPVHVLLPAVPEHLRIRAAAVEPEHDRRARRRGLLQFRQRLGQRDRQPGRLPGHEAHRPPVMRGDVGVRAAPFRLAALVVPALGDRLGAGVGDEMVIDVVHPGGDRVRRPASPGRPSPAAPADRAASAIAASAGRRVRRCGSTASPASGPAHDAVRCLTCSIVSAPSAKHMLVTDSSATSPDRYPPVPRPAPAADSSTCPAPARAVYACSSIAPA